MQQGEQVDVLMDCDAVSARKAIDVDYFRQKVLRRGGFVVFEGAYVRLAFPKIMLENDGNISLLKLIVIVLKETCREDIHILLGSIFEEQYDVR